MVQQLYYGLQSDGLGGHRNHALDKPWRGRLAAARSAMDARGLELTTRRTTLAGSGFGI